ncbi:ARPP-1 family domain-containing protein [Lacibacter sediminis]|uniref:ARG and Rhodanese-Phosphatase-superfamily-associated domain-containing protein n=1 Tax=Lacibacter sediminis TaxID=2760713 RepID=A0A7G5XI28_9BACT|nr:DUF6569 family protein [Lacibacter sediminis]QNA45131.1 hypothetical protein H4075_02730 [Lacibacter sediminis]
MKKHFCLLILILTCVATYAQTDFTFPSLVVEYDSAIVFRNLKLVPIKRIEQSKDRDYVSPNSISLKVGMAKGSVKLKERGNYMLDNINVLLIENNSGKDLVIKSGEIVMGGRQDRVFARDTILETGKQHLVPVYCIEENRWSEKEKKFFYRGTTGSGLQTIIDTAQNQTKVWDEIRRLLKQNNQTGSSSYAALLNNKKIADTSQQYIRYFLQALRSKDSSIVGIIASTGHKILGADVFISTSLFYQTLPGLLEKYCTEAVLTGTAASANHSRESVYTNEMLSPQTQNSFLSKKGKRFFYKNVLIQLTGFSHLY